MVKANQSEKFGGSTCTQDQGYVLAMWAMGLKAPSSLGEEETKGASRPA